MTTIKRRLSALEARQPDPFALLTDAGLAEAIQQAAQAQLDAGVPMPPDILDLTRRDAAGEVLSRREAARVISWLEAELAA